MSTDNVVFTKHCTPVILRLSLERMTGSTNVWSCKVRKAASRLQRDFEMMTVRRDGHWRPRSDIAGDYVRTIAYAHVFHMHQTLAREVSQYNWLVRQYGRFSSDAPELPKVTLAYPEYPDLSDEHTTMSEVNRILLAPPVACDI